MKRVSLPVDPELRREAEVVLDDGESLSDFIAACVRSGISRRRTQNGFLRRSQDAVARGVRDGSGITPKELLERMDARLDEAQSCLSSHPRSNPID